MQCGEDEETLGMVCGSCHRTSIPIVEAQIAKRKITPRIAKFHCPNCHEKIKCDIEVEGREVACPVCKFKFIPTIEETDEEVGPPVAVSADSAAPARRGGIPLCDPCGEVADSAGRPAADSQQTRRRAEWAAVNSAGRPAAGIQQSQADQLHARADTAGMAGTFLLIVSLIALFIVWTGDSDIRPAATIVAGGFFFFALFLFVIAQLIHIRANTEK